MAYQKLYRWIPCFALEPMGCETNEFQCVSDKVCLPVQWRCDNFVDCHDESDEENCGQYRHT